MFKIYSCKSTDCLPDVTVTFFCRLLLVYNLGCSVQVHTRCDGLECRLSPSQLHAFILLVVQTQTCEYWLLMYILWLKMYLALYVYCTILQYIPIQSCRWKNPNQRSFLFMSSPSPSWLDLHCPTSLLTADPTSSVNSSEFYTVGVYTDTFIC